MYRVYKVLDHLEEKPALAVHLEKVRCKNMILFWFELAQLSSVLYLYEK